MSQYEFRMLHLQTTNLRSLIINTVYKERHGIDEKLQILIYKFSIAKLQF